MAEGGEVDEMGEYDPMQHPGPKDNESANMEDADMIARIMHSRKKYSKGGQVANQEHGENNNELAGFSPNEFDDLVLRDDDMEDADYTGSNSGDELSSEGEDSRRKDIVAKIMASRRKKDRLPNPR